MKGPQRRVRVVIRTETNEKSRTMVTPEYLFETLDVAEGRVTIGAGGVTIRAGSSNAREAEVFYPHHRVHAVITDRRTR